MARPAERFVKPLSKTDTEQLTRAWKSGDSHRLRCRAHAILLSAEKWSVTEIAEVFQVTTQTVYAWLERWDSDQDLEDAPRSGAPPKLNDAEAKLALDELKISPHDPRNVIERVESHTGKRISLDILRRLAHRCGYVWKRVRGSLRTFRDEAAFQAAKSDIVAFSRLRDEADVNLWFFDEAAFSLTPSIPYAWQKIGETVELPYRRGTSYSAVGFVDLDSQFHAYQFKGTVTSAVAMAVMDKFTEQVTGTNIVVIDNAPVHRSRAFQDRVEYWRTQGVHLYFLPPYSPELNLIELIWKQMKHHWLPLSAYKSPQALWQQLGQTLASIGETHRLNFAPLGLYE